ncbi:MAG: hypothetical protein MJB57_03845 [Gemmatimonadetes bacterium]|nr:hypothetical protein [Gemmatimonadota bacterium]
MTEPISSGRLVVAALRLDLWSPDEVAARAREGLHLGVGGFILFGGDADAVGRLTERLRRESSHALLIGADLERGAGQQFRGLRELPPPAALAGLEDAAAAAEEAGAATARDALAVGVDWVLAPVLDLDAERSNPIVATRSFGPDPARVAELGARWIDGCQREGALACAKHFPGHGRTTDDSHIGLPVVRADPETLAQDLAPFEAVAGRVATAMAAHVAFPVWGGDRPATLSPEILGGILRDRIGFDGPVATDAMIMGAVGDDDAAAAVEALRAGCGLILYPSDVAATVGAIDRAQVEAGLAPRAVEARTRIVRALDRSRIAAADPGAPTNGSPAPDPLDLAVRTIVGDRGALEGWRGDATTAVVPVSDDPEVGPPAGRDGPLGALLLDELRDAGWRVSEALGDVTGADRVIVVLAATPKGWKGHGGPSPEALEAVRGAVAGVGSGLVVLLGHARWIEALDQPAIAAWSTESTMERAAARWIIDAAAR